MAAQGFSCSAFQALPAHLRSADDAAMLKLSSEQRWKKCPACHNVVERSEGCNHIRCRCGTGFCYLCGLKYLSNKATAENQHGKAACRCSLFDVPAEGEEVANPVAAMDPGHLLHGIEPGIMFGAWMGQGGFAATGGKSRAGGVCIGRASTTAATDSAAGSGMMRMRSTSLDAPVTFDQSNHPVWQWVI